MDQQRKSITSRLLWISFAITVAGLLLLFTALSPGLAKK